jgi:hypothetical protein
MVDLAAIKVSRSDNVYLTEVSRSGKFSTDDLLK